MKTINWDSEKNAWLKAVRGVSFEEIVFHIHNGQILDQVRHPNPDKYESQMMWIVAIDDYAYLVPYVENEQEIFLKTIIPSRKATREYLRKDGRL